MEHVFHAPSSFDGVNAVSDKNWSHPTAIAPVNTILFKPAMKTFVFYSSNFILFCAEPWQADL
ncbi:MAG: hypothetical protein ACFB0E_05690 [Leptolyngbyaceae cyanobacterium]